jgi:hypothetical protein
MGHHRGRGSGRVRSGVPIIENLDRKCCWGKRNFGASRKAHRELIWWAEEGFWSNHLLKCPSKLLQCLVACNCGTNLECDKLAMGGRRSWRT